MWKERMKQVQPKAPSKANQIWELTKEKVRCFRGGRISKA